MNHWSPKDPWDEHPFYTALEWKCQVAADHTRVGYNLWVNLMLDDKLAVETIIDGECAELVFRYDSTPSYDRFGRPEIAHTIHPEYYRIFDPETGKPSRARRVDFNLSDAQENDCIEAIDSIDG